MKVAKYSLQHFTYDDLYDLYVRQTMSAPKIAAMRGCDKATVYNALVQHGIPTRADGRKWTLLSKDDLYRMYVTDGKSTTQIAEELRLKPSLIWGAIHHYGIPIRPRVDALRLAIKKGKDSPNWTGGRKIDVGGYVWLYSPEHPYATKQGYVKEHRLVMEHKLGRYLLPSEEVHHHNGIRSDNREENLEVLNGSNHTLRTMFCSSCPVRKEVQRLHRIIESLERSLNEKLDLSKK